MPKRRALELTELVEELDRSKHPGDPRVILTQRRDVLEGVMQATFFQAAIWHRYQRPEKTALHRAFADMVKATKTDLNSQTDVTANSENRVKLVFPPQLEGDTYKIIKDEFKKMAETYCSMTGIARSKINIMSGFQTGGLHQHDAYPVLNCNWLRTGTLWTNPAGVTQHANEGDWFFLKPGFEHMSPIQTKETDITIIVMPR